MSRRDGGDDPFWRRAGRRRRGVGGDDGSDAPSRGPDADRRPVAPLDPPRAAGGPPRRGSGLDREYLDDDLFGDDFFEAGPQAGQPRRRPVSEDAEDLRDEMRAQADDASPPRPAPPAAPDAEPSAAEPEGPRGAEPAPEPPTAAAEPKAPIAPSRSDRPARPRARPKPPIAPTPPQRPPHAPLDRRADPQPPAAERTAAPDRKSPRDEPEPRAPRFRAPAKPETPTEAPPRPAARPARPRSGPGLVNVRTLLDRDDLPGRDPAQSADDAVGGRPLDPRGASAPEAPQRPSSRPLAGMGDGATGASRFDPPREREPEPPIEPPVKLIAPRKPTPEQVLPPRPPEPPAASEPEAAPARPTPAADAPTFRQAPEPPAQDPPSAPPPPAPAEVAKAPPAPSDAAAEPPAPPVAPSSAEPASPPQEPTPPPAAVASVPADPAPSEPPAPPPEPAEEPAETADEPAATDMAGQPAPASGATPAPVPPPPPPALPSPEAVDAAVARLERLREEARRAAEQAEAAAAAMAAAHQAADETEEEREAKALAEQEARRMADRAAARSMLDESREPPSREPAEPTPEERAAMAAAEREEAVSRDFAHENGFGPIIVGARFTAGLMTPEAVEAELRIKARYIRAIEALDLDELPDGAYLPGYVRAYLRHLAPHLPITPDEGFELFRRELAYARGEDPDAPPVEAPAPVLNRSALERVSRSGGAKAAGVPAEPNSVRAAAKDVARKLAAARAGKGRRAKISAAAAISRASEAAPVDLPIARQGRLGAGRTSSAGASRLAPILGLAAGAGVVAALYFGWDQLVGGGQPEQEQLRVVRRIDPLTPPVGVTRPAAATYEPGGIISAPAEPPAPAPRQTPEVAPEAAAAGGADQDVASVEPQPGAPPSSETELPAPPVVPSQPRLAPPAQPPATPGVRGSGEQEAAAPVSTPTPTPTPPPTGPALAVRAIDQTWVRLRDGAGQTLFEGVIAPGRMIPLSPADAAFDLRTGNAGGVMLIVDGVAYGPLGAVGEVRSVSIERAAAAGLDAAPAVTAAVAAEAAAAQ